MDPVAISILGLPGWAWLWIITVISLTVFSLRAVKLYNLLHSAQPENRFKNIFKRTGMVITNVLGQKRLLNERFGFIHFLFFWGFVFYATTFWWGMLRGLFPFLPVHYPDEVAPVVFLLEIFGVLVLAGIVAAVIRRMFFPPERLEISRDAYNILLLISALVLSFLIGQGFHINGSSGLTAAAAPVGTMLAALLSEMSTGTADMLYIAMWWLHMGVVLFFLAYLPYSKHMHLLVAPFNVYFTDQKAAVDLSFGNTDELMAGASQWQQFTWRQLLDGLACAECGRCDRVCPALNSGYTLSPKMMIHHLKEHMLEDGLKKTNGSNGARSLIGDIVSEDEIWACTTCYACMNTCPVFNEHIPSIVQMRRHLVGEGQIEQGIQDTLMKVARYGNSFGKSDRMRPKWTAELDFKIKDARREPVEYLWYLGDYASYDPRVAEITKTTARIFQKAGLDFGILYEGERNAGNDIRRMGEEGLFGMLSTKNLQVLNRARFEKIVTTDPHTFNTLKNEYPLNGKSDSVIHYSQLIHQLLEEKKLVPQKALNERVTYHDPCYLGRYNNIYEEPRHVLKALGAELIEMPRNREKSYCCGAGGGQIWRDDVAGIDERPAENRIREAVDLKDVQTFVVTCPKDIAMYGDAVKTTGAEDKIQVKDLSEIVWASLN